jgi:septal ring factor EnvC (AmiA/AmiB activator)
MLGKVYGQTSRKELENRKKRLQKEIDETDRLIKDTRKDKNASLSQLKILNKKLESRKKLIRAIQSEMNNLNSSIQTTEEKIKTLKSDVEQLKINYGTLVRRAYLNRNKESVMMMLFSSEDITQAYKRLYYLRKYNQYRRDQAIMLQQTGKELNEKQKELKINLSQKRDLLGVEEKQEKVLSKEKTEQQTTIKILSKKEKKLKQDLEKKLKEKKSLDREIQKIIEREIALERERAISKSKAEAEIERKKAISEGRPVPAATETVYRVTPETKALSGKFEANKGNLPWPVSRGVITESFGTHPHPVLKGITTNNNGIDIATSPGAAVKAIFDGVVTGVISIPGANRAVIVKHGEYLTVYSNLASVSVNKGDAVNAGSPIGIADTDNDSGKAEAHLEIWKGKEKLNPELWIAR